MKTYLKEELEKLLGFPESAAGREHNYSCPTPSCIGHLHVNYTRNAALCHKCGLRTRDLAWLLRDLGGGLPRKIAPKSPGRLYETVRGILAEDDDQAVELPKEYIRLHRQGTYASMIYTYLKYTRHMTEWQMDACGVGYCKRGKYSGCAVFPVYMWGRLVYFTTRRVLGVGKKSLHPKLPKNGVLFNFDNARKEELVCVCEGPLSALACERVGYGAVALLGHSISDRGISLLSEMETEEIVVCLDPDKRTEEQRMAARIARSVEQDVYCAGLKGGDPDDLTPEQLLYYIQNAAPVDLVRLALIELGEELIN